MRPTSYVVAVALALALSGCSGGGSDDPDSEASAAPVVLAGCEDVVDQEVSVDFEPAPGTDQRVDASIGRNFNAVGAPCVDVFVWDAPRGWVLDHYEVAADFGGGLKTSLRSANDDFVEALRFTSLMSCAKVHAELVYRKKGRPAVAPARFVVDSRVCVRPGLDP